MAVSQAAVNSAVANSTSLLVSEAIHLQTVALTMNLSGSVNDAPIERKRPDIRGGGRGTTVLKANSNIAHVLKVQGGASGFQAHDDQVVRDLAFHNGNQGAWPNMVGLHMQSIAFASLQNLSFNGFGVGLKLESYLSGLVSNIKVRGCPVGIEAGQGGGFSPLNAVTFDKTILHWCSQWGLKTTDNAYCNLVSGLNVELCGTHGDGSTGGMRFVSSYPGQGMTFQGCWFEANGGAADIEFVNNSDGWVTHNIIGCTFIRLSGTLHTLVNIKSTGKNRFNIIGCNFQDDGSYVPDPARPYFLGDGQEQIICMGNTYWTPATQGPLT